MQNKKTNPAFTIMRRELAAFFTNPAAYIVTVIFLVASGIFFFSTFFINGRADLRNFFSLLPIMLSLFVPALTMRLFSEELRSGSFETLMTLPVTSAQVILGKFLAAFLTSAAMLVPTLFYVVTACVFGKVDFGPIIGGYFGALFLCALYSAIGIFSSALTKNQIIAFFTTLALSFALILFGMILVFLPAPLVRFFSWLSVTTHFQQISRGIADTRDIIYFVSLSAIFLLLTQQKISVKKNRDEKIDCAIFFLILILANLVGARAFLRKDLTSGKMYSISSASKELVKNLQEPMSVNVFFSSDLPAPYNSVDQYLRDILVEYKSAANKNFSYKIFDMKKTENENIAHSYGINQIQVQKVETTEVSAKAVWMGIAIAYGDDIKIFNPIDSTAGLEYRLTTAMSKMISINDALAQLNRGLEVKLFPASELAQFNISNLDRLEQTVSDATNSLNEKFFGKINLKIENPSSDEAKQISEKYGVQLVTFQDDEDENGGEKNVALGIVAELGENFVSIPLYLMQDFFGWHLLGLENIQKNISDAIESLLSKTVQIGYITGHGENELYANPYGNPGALNSENFRNVLGDIYDLRQINLAEEEIPLNIKCIVINGSKEEFSQSELFKIDQFVMKGGNILFCLDPLVESAENGPNAPP
ncbi:MAG: Gldg family protein, partial [Treponemataceae bacterium]|nr:Gldg family protein [Treponemataceae bacterium]